MTLALWWNGFALGIAVWLVLRFFKQLSAAERFQIWALYLCALPLLHFAMPISSAPLLQTIAVSPSVVKAVQAPRVWPFYWTIAAILASWSLIKLMAATRIWHRARGDGYLRYSDEVSGPVACGILRTAILLPLDAKQWTECRLDQVIRHEQAHCDRKDVLLDLLATLAVAFFWLQPFAWFALRRMRREREWAADDRVLKDGLDRIEYAQTIYKLTAESSLQPAMAGTGRGSLEERMIHLLNNNAPRRPATAVSALLATLLLAALAFTLPKIVTAQDTPAKKWDVAPKLIYKVEPAYTQFARDAQIEGTTTLSLRITADGEPENIQVTSSLEPGLDEQAIMAIEQWTFAPAQKGGKPIDTDATIEVNFRLL